MRNSMKVARWEIKRNLKNKSFVISLFLTPAIFVAIMMFPYFISLFQDDSDPITVYITDELNVWNDQYRSFLDDEREWNIKLNPTNEEEVFQQLEQSDHIIYIVLNESSLNDGVIPVYMSENVDQNLAAQFKALENPLRFIQLEKIGVSPEHAEKIIHGIGFEYIPVSAETDSKAGTSEQVEDPLKKIIPSAFAGLILFSVMITGMMIFQSASQEKKEKISEMILSSITPEELMQGKIYGYFVLGIVQVFIWFAIAIPILQWRFDIPIVQYILVPEIVILLFFAIAGYLMFAAMFVGLGATVEDMTTSGNFQGFVFMIPWVPFMLFSPIMLNPEGTVALFGTYFPLTTPGVMILRLALLDEYPWGEIIISAVILIAFIWLLMKLAGKIFKTGILLYGKNATPKEIWKWLRY